MASVDMEHEELVVHRGARSGVYGIVAVHSTALGPALGGVRMWSYPSVDKGVDDALRLAHGMTMKAAAAGLDLGGGKGVICLPSGGLSDPQRQATLHDFGDLVGSLGGRYITAEDVGTGPEDMAVIAERTPHVVGLPEALGGSGDPSPLTARGVAAAIRACCERRFGTADLTGVRVCVMGLGSVGSRLSRLLADAGAELLVSDIDLGKRALADELGARWISAGDAALTPCEVLAPCALGEVVNEGNVERLSCEIICGAANNQLAAEHLAQRLAERSILYAPDFIVNSGGLIKVYAELHGLDGQRVKQLVEGIGDALLRVLDAAEGQEPTPLEAARAIAAERLAGSGRKTPAAIGSAA